MMKSQQAFTYASRNSATVMKATFFAILVSTFLLAACGHLEAAFSSGLISVDFDLTAGTPTTQTGPAVIGASGDLWNSVTNISAITTGTLLLSTGAASNGVTLSLDAATAASFVLQGPFSGTPYDSLMRDGYSELNGNRLILNGLTPLQQYDVYLYSDVFGNDNHETNFTINGDTHFVINSGGLSTFVENNNYAHFAAKTADATGQLVVIVGQTLVSQPGPFVNGFQITPVPEPSCAMLLTAGGAVLAYFYRRGRHIATWPAPDESVSLRSLG
jgi:hypothetical protein